MNKRILVVDDSELILETIKAALAHVGIDAITHAGPLGIQQLVEQHQPALLLLDIQMPMLNGAVLCRLMKGHSATRHLPIIFHSVLDEPELARLVAECGADGHLRKMSDLGALAARVLELLETHGSKRREGV